MSVQLVADREIQKAVLRLIRDATQEIILVSLYNNKLTDLIEALKKADKNRNKINISWYYCQGKKPSRPFPEG